jgi:membrane protein implicated in regulation of membrane protease activity
VVHFFFLGLGVAAIVVGTIDSFFPITLSVELFIWALLSIAYFLLWKKWFKEEEVSNIGQSDYSLNTQGTVTKTITPTQRGEVSFDTPVLGSTLWIASAKETIESGSRIAIVDVRGQIIEVTPL